MPDEKGSKMFRDRSLVPGQAVRLLALGLLAESPRTYAELASEVRRVTGLLVGPSLDLLAPPLELLRIEGLAEERQGLLSLTLPGRSELERLLAAPLRQGASDLKKLVVALKLRFLQLLDTEQRLLQLEALIEDSEGEQARLTALAESTADNRDFGEWLALEQAKVRDRLDWMRGRAAALRCDLGD